MTTQSHPKHLGKYEILSVLGRGGMGIVYKARDAVIERDVAIKTISSNDSNFDHQQVERLLTEARSAGRLHHPNIVTVFDFGEEGGISYVVLEYCEGVDLAHVIEEKRAMSLIERIEIILQICRGLGYAHDCGVVHRDMKPANVRLTTNGAAKILDFGLARYDDTSLTKSGYITGTIAYMSPERMHGTSGPADDIFALGATAYELLTYQRAFPGQSTPEVMMKIMTQTPPAPSTVAEVPPEFDAVLLKCMARTPEERFASVHDFAAALEEALDASHEFIASPTRSEGFRHTLSGAKTKWRKRSYAAQTQVVPTETLGQMPTLNDVPKSTLASTVVVPQQPKRNRAMLFGVAAAVAAIAVGGVFVARKSSEPPKPAPVVVATHTVAPPVKVVEAKAQELAAPVHVNPIEKKTPPHSLSHKPAEQVVIAKPQPVPQPQPPPEAYVLW